MSTYLPVSEISSQYHLPERTVYTYVSEIESCDRYRDAWAVLDGGRRKLINLLVFEDYLRHRVRLQHRNLAKLLPPYDPEVVMRQRGERT